MALFKISKGSETNLPSILTNGYCYFCTDTLSFYIDYENTDGTLTRSKLAAKYADKLRYTQDGSSVEIDPTELITINNYATVIGTADTDKDGLMAASDKEKLDGIDIEHVHDDRYYTEAEIDAMEFITVDDIDNICGASIQQASEVVF